MPGFIISTNMVWIVLIILFAVVELATPQLLSIWFAAGAVAALLVSVLGGWLWLQVFVFIAVSLILLFMTKPLARRLKGNPEPTNADMIIGKEGVVVQDIDNEAASGQIKVIGQIWTARSTGDIFIKEGVHVIVREIEGVKAMVEPYIHQ